MTFLALYGLFALKVFTFVIALLVLVAGIAALSKKPLPKLQVKSISKEYEDLLNLMQQQMKKKPQKSKLSRKERKALKDKPSLYVLDFKGDIKASQVEQLREEITAILAIATQSDEVLLRLESPGGSVSGYGLAASQLQRIRDKNISLTVCIDKVAASGGYLMSCVANRILAAPFAIVGSIGVVAQLPNLHRWLKKNDIDVELITAGEYKRTLTVLGENTEKGRKKFQEDIEKIHHAFRDYVFQHRGQLDIDKVSTGEHWLAKDAFNLGLVDELQTSDDYLLSKLKDFSAYRIHKHQKPSFFAKLMTNVYKTSKLWI